MSSAASSTSARWEVAKQGAARPSARSLMSRDRASAFGSTASGTVRASTSLTSALSSSRSDKSAADSMFQAATSRVIKPFSSVLIAPNGATHRFVRLSIPNYNLVPRPPIPALPFNNDSNDHVSPASLTPPIDMHSLQKSSTFGEVTMMLPPHWHGASLDLYSALPVNAQIDVAAYTNKAASMEKSVCVRGFRCATSLLYAVTFDPAAVDAAIASNSNVGPINRTYTLTFFVTSHDEAEREKSNGRTTLETFNTGSLTTARGWILALLRLLTARNDAAQAVDRFSGLCMSARSNTPTTRVSFAPEPEKPVRDSTKHGKGQGNRARISASGPSMYANGVPPSSNDTISYPSTPRYASITAVEDELTVPPVNSSSSESQRVDPVAVSAMAAAMSKRLAMQRTLRAKSLETGT